MVWYNTCAASEDNKVISSSMWRVVSSVQFDVGTTTSGRATLVTATFTSDYNRFTFS